MNPLGYDPKAEEGGVRLVVVAGPNASGKSTLTAELKKNQHFPGLYINADDIARSEPLAAIADYGQRNLKAAQIADQQRKDALAMGKPFAFETVLSTPAGIALITEARTKGYDVQAAFITTEHADINVEREAIRVARGGHSVPEEKIRSRYAEAMRLLPHVIDHATRADVFDASVNDVMNWVAHKSNSQLERRIDPAPSWYQNKLEDPYLSLRDSKQQIADEFRAYKNRERSSDGRILIADASHGREYGGQIISVTDKHVLHRATADLYILHDRVFHPGREFTVGKTVNFHYQYQAGKLVNQPTPLQEISR